MLSKYVKCKGSTLIVNLLLPRPGLEPDPPFHFWTEWSPFDGLCTDSPTSSHYFHTSTFLSSKPHFTVCTQAFKYASCIRRFRCRILAFWLRVTLDHPTRLSCATTEGDNSSLIWKPPPHYDRRIPGYVEGYVRRFWQVCISQVDSGRKLIVCFRPGKIVLLRPHSHLLTRRKVRTIAERLKPQGEL